MHRSCRHIRRIPSASSQSTDEARVECLLVVRSRERNVKIRYQIGYRRSLVVWREGYNVGDLAPDRWPVLRGPLRDETSLRPGADGDFLVSDG